MGPLQYDNLDARDKEQMMSDFELGVQPQFHYGGRNDRLAIDLRGVMDDVERGIEDGTIVLNLYAILPHSTQQQIVGTKNKFPSLLTAPSKDLQKVFFPTCNNVGQLIHTPSLPPRRNAGLLIFNF